MLTPEPALPFELDGALVGSVAGIQASCGAALNALGHSSPTPPDLSGLIGPPIEDIMRTLLARYRDDRVAKSVAAYRADYVERGLFCAGRGPFTRQSARIFAGRYRDSHLVQTVEHIRFVRPDVAIVNTMFAVTGYASLPPGARSDDGVLRTRSEQVMTFDDGRWHVASFHNVPVDLAAIAAAGPP